MSVQVISQYMRRHLGLRELTFADIRRATALAPAVSYPIQGLDPDGLARALAEIGCAPCTYVRRGFGLGKQWLPLAQERPDFAQMVDLLHVYIDSQLPVVLGLSARSRDSETHHAVCAVGHTIGKTPNPAIAAARNRNRGQGNIHTATEFVRDIIVHDDEVGPYLLLPVATSQMYNKDGTPGQYDTLWKESLQEHLSLMVVPVPFGVHVSASIALKSVRDALTAIASGYELEVQKVGGQASAALVRECGEALKTGSVITNLFLDLGQRVLENVLAVPEAIAEKNQKHLLQMTWPKYVWVAELSTSSLIGRPFSERRTLGFFVLDATTPWGRDVCMLVRLPGLLSCPPVDGEGSGDRRDFPDGHDEFGMLVVRNYMRSGWSKPAPSEEVTGA